MEAKDTVMKDSQIWDIILQIIISPEEPIVIQDGRAIAKAQAEITAPIFFEEGRKAGYDKAVKDAVVPIEKAFKGGKKAGIREVVEWLKPNGLVSWYDTSCGHGVICIKQEDWQDKLKELGIE